jgi:DNA-binding NarL/FixJ family response regulator
MIRIALVTPSGILRDLVVATLEDEPDIVVVGEVPGSAGLEQVLEQTPADLVIWSNGGHDISHLFQGLLEAHPRLKVLAVRNDGRRSSLWELRPHPTELGEISPRLLVETIRKVVPV